MLLEVEVSSGANSPLDLHRMFDLLSEPAAVRRVWTANLSGEDGWCEVTGWGPDGPCPANAALSEDSGEGVVLLVYGGPEGVRLRPSGADGEWDLTSRLQWGEACLMLDKDAPFE